MRSLFAATWAALLLSRASARPDHFDVPTDDRDLFRYVSRPDIMPPRFTITTYDADEVAPGYLFVAPYDDLRTRFASTTYKTGQTGPHIYDQSGELIWSGAHLFGDRATFDFKISIIDDTDFATFVVMEDPAAPLAGGAGVILDSSYRRHANVLNHVGRGTTNMHEFSLTDNGKSALWITFQSQLADASTNPEHEAWRWAGNNGFAEVDAATGISSFTWWALDHIHLNESAMRVPLSNTAYTSPWDFFHANSIEKDENGDYLMSARFMNTIYKISGKDGSIMWRLGGRLSDFEIQGFNFSSQHDARQLEANSTHTVISLFDNASDGRRATSKHSSGLVIALDMIDMKATLLQKLDRPDGLLTELRGNLQTLPNGNRFICWSENARISEFNPDGRLVYDLEFAAHRFVTYRGYKLNWVGRPLDPPDVKSLIYGADRQTSTTAVYASWNGATEVETWNFFGGSRPGEGGDFKLLGSVSRTGFETVLMVSGFNERVVAEAVAANGTVLGRSVVCDSELPVHLQGGAQSGLKAESPMGSSNGHSASSLKKPISTPTEQRPGRLTEVLPAPDVTQGSNQQSGEALANSWPYDDHRVDDEQLDEDTSASKEPTLGSKTPDSSILRVLGVLVLLGAVAAAGTCLVSRHWRRRKSTNYEELAKYDED